MSQETGSRSSSKRVNDIVSTARSTNQETRILYEFGPYLLDPSERKLCRGDEIVALPPKAFDTLLLMVRNSGRLMEKGELIETLWPDSFVEEGSLSNNVFLLRKALGEDPQYIETVPKRGYRFVGAVRCLPDGIPGHRDEAEFQTPRPGAVAVAAKALPILLTRAVGIASLVLLTLLAAAVWYYQSSGWSHEAIHSVAVLPFENPSGDLNTEYLSDGIAESLINSLSQLPNIKVMSRDSAFH